MIEELDIFADLHPVFSRGHSNRYFPKRARKSRGYRFAAKTLERINYFLPEQDQRVSIDGGGDVNNIRARQICRDGGGAALIDIDGSRDYPLDGHGRSQLIDRHVKTAFGKVPAFQGNEQRQAGGSRSGGTDLETALLRLGKDRRFGSFGNPRPDGQ